jgi:hypothetical protein
MPPKSKKQEKLMRAVANNPDFAKKVGIKQSVGKEFMKKYREGGMSEADKKTFGETEMDQAPPPNFKKSKEDKKPVPADKKDSLGKLPKDVRNKMGYMKKGGKVGMGMTKNKYKKGGKVSSCSKRADGCAVKGKTKGRMI